MDKMCATKQLNKTRLRQGDEVQVMVGKVRGEKGKIDRIDFKNQLVYISGVNIYKRHTKPTSVNSPSGILDKVMPMHWSNVKVVDPKSKKATRVGYRIDGADKHRFAKVSGALLDKVSSK